MPRYTDETVSAIDLWGLSARAVKAPGFFRTVESPRCQKNARP